MTGGDRRGQEMTGETISFENDKMARLVYDSLLKLVHSGLLTTLGVGRVGSWVPSDGL